MQTWAGMATTPAQPHILVIDDTPEIRDLFQELLDEEGYRVTLLSAVPDDLAAVRRFAPDLLLLDYSFGGTGAGWRLIEAATRDPDLARLPIVLCTAAVEAVRERAAELQAMGVAVVLKPFDLEELLAALAMALARPDGRPLPDDAR